MRYWVYAVTAAQFVAELYGGRAGGRRLGEAVSWARRNLANEPERRIAYEGRPLQDWCVPVVWERAPLACGQKNRMPLHSISNWTMAQQQNQEHSIEHCRWARM